MSRIVLSTIGTNGDFVPFVALGRALSARGHDVVVAVNPAAIPLFEAAGLATAACGARYGAEEARSHRALFDEWRAAAPPRDLIRRIFDLEDNYRALAGICRGADLLVSISLQLAAPRVHDALGIPWVAVSLLPGEIGTRGAALRGRLPPPADLSPLPGPWLFLEYLRAPRILLASSRHFHGDTVSGFDGLRETGFWFDDEPASWRPPAEVERFIREGPPPIVLSFGSLPVEDASRIVSLHLDAARALGMRLLVQRGWGDLAGGNGLESGGNDVLFADHLPHDWLFPRSTAIAHHGGIGVTARALRHGVPMVVEPHGRDQFFNAWRIVALGVGVAMHPHELTVRSLGQAFERLAADRIQRRVAELSQQLGEERGIDRACDLIEDYLHSPTRESHPGAM